ncbi:UNVERIFIED_CONTAM: hypothetical protein FKN15_053423 [Acipenser sinensis]
MYVGGTIIDIVCPIGCYCILQSSVVYPRTAGGTCQSGQLEHCTLLGFSGTALWTQNVLLLRASKNPRPIVDSHLPVRVEAFCPEAAHKNRPGRNELLVLGLVCLFFLPAVGGREIRVVRGNGVWINCTFDPARMKMNNVPVSWYLRQGNGSRRVQHYENASSEPPQLTEANCMRVTTACQNLTRKRMQINTFSHHTVTPVLIGKPQYGVPSLINSCVFAYKAEEPFANWAGAEKGPPHYAQPEEVPLTERITITRALLQPEDRFWTSERDSYLDKWRREAQSHRRPFVFVHSCTEMLTTVAKEEIKELFEDIKSVTASYEPPQLTEALDTRSFTCSSRNGFPPALVTWTGGSGMNYTPDSVTQHTLNPEGLYDVVSKLTRRFTEEETICCTVWNQPLQEHKTNCTRVTPGRQNLTRMRKRISSFSDDTVIVLIGRPKHGMSSLINSCVFAYKVKEHFDNWAGAVKGPPHYAQPELVPLTEHITITKALLQPEDRFWTSERDSYLDKWRREAQCSRCPFVFVQRSSESGIGFFFSEAQSGIGFVFQNLRVGRRVRFSGAQSWASGLFFRSSESGIGFFFSEAQSGIGFVFQNLRVGRRVRFSGAQSWASGLFFRSSESGIGFFFSEAQSGIGFVFQNLRVGRRVRFSGAQSWASGLFFRSSESGIGFFFSEAQSGIGFVFQNLRVGRRVRFSGAQSWASGLFFRSSESGIGFFFSEAQSGIGFVFQNLRVGRRVRFSGAQSWASGLFFRSSESGIGFFFSEAQSGIGFVFQNLRVGRRVRFSGAQSWASGLFFRSSESGIGFFFSEAQSGIGFVFQNLRVGRRVRFSGAQSWASGLFFRSSESGIGFFFSEAQSGIGFVFQNLRVGRRVRFSGAQSWASDDTVIVLIGRPKHGMSSLINSCVFAYKVKEHFDNWAGAEKRPPHYAQPEEVPLTEHITITRALLEKEDRFWTSEREAYLDKWRKQVQCSRCPFVFVHRMKLFVIGLILLVVKRTGVSFVKKITAVHGNDVRIECTFDAARMRQASSYEPPQLTEALDTRSFTCSSRNGFPPSLVTWTGGSGMNYTPDSVTQHTLNPEGLYDVVTSYEPPQLTEALDTRSFTCSSRNGFPPSLVTWTGGSGMNYTLDSVTQHTLNPEGLYDVVRRQNLTRMRKRISSFSDDTVIVLIGRPKHGMSSLINAYVFAYKAEEPFANWAGAENGSPHYAQPEEVPLTEHITTTRAARGQVLDQ